MAVGRVNDTARSPTDNRAATGLIVVDKMGGGKGIFVDLALPGLERY